MDNNPIVGKEQEFRSFLLDTLRRMNEELVGLHKDIASHKEDHYKEGREIDEKISKIQVELALMSRLPENIEKLESTASDVRGLLSTTKELDNIKNRLDELDEFKNKARGGYIVFGVVISILTIVVGWLAVLK